MVINDSDAGGAGDREYGEYGVPAADGPRADLHVHSDASDGRFAPPEVVRLAAGAGVAALALTDHDTVAGLQAARSAARECDIEFVDAIELSCHHPERGSTHVLGYFIDPDDPELGRCLAGLQGGRRERACEIVDRLNALGIGVTLEQVVAQASQAGLIARPHVARALLEGGWVESFREAFDRFIAAGRPAYVPTPSPEPAEGIARIRAAGGIAVLAHPGEDVSVEWLEELVGAGLRGIEVCHPEHGPDAVRRLRELAASLGLLETGGSDWHGNHRGRTRGLGSQRVPYEWYERLREAAGAGAPAAERIRGREG